MAVFDYIAFDPAGKRSKGTITADSERHARRLLRDRGLFADSIKALKQAAEGEARKRFTLGTRRLNHFELALILRQMAILIQSGLPLEDALKMLTEQAESDKQRRFVQSLRSEIVEGRSFSSAMSRSPYKVPESVIAGVGVGEETGHLHSVMLRMADELEVGAENKQAFSRGLIYPFTLLAVATVVVSFMMVFVVPQITTIFVSNRRELPLITEIVVFISNGFQAYGLYVLILAALVFFVALVLLRDKARRTAWHGTLLKLPLIGKWMRMANIGDWSRSLGTLLESGVPALSALKIASSVVDNLYLRAKMESVTESMRRGSSLHSALQQADVGSGFLVHMVGSGEASSELDSMLLRVADYYRARLSNSVETFLKLMNPILIVLLGIIVLCIVAAIMLPILDLNNMV